MKYNASTARRRRDRWRYFSDSAIIVYIYICVYSLTPLSLASFDFFSLSLMSGLSFFSFSLGVAAEFIER